MKIISIFSIILISGILNLTIAQDGLNSSITTNTPVQSETVSFDRGNLNASQLQQLEKMHKLALLNGNESEAQRIENEMNALLPEENKFTRAESRSNFVVIDKNSTKEPLVTDWQGLNSLITADNVNPSSSTGRNIEIKQGEDNCLYALINKGYDSPSYRGSWEVRRSSNFGMTWVHVIGLSNPTHISGVTFVVESKLNSNPDSTRITVMYIENEDFTISETRLSYYSILGNGNNSYSGTISNSIPGHKFTHITSVSDGAFWEGPTYFGCVVTVADTLTGTTQYLKFFRTMSWGLTWNSATLNTSTSDVFPSAAYKEGAGDSIYIAVEIHLGAFNAIRVIATSWGPSASFKTYLLTGSTGKYEKPCITIKQNNPADSILITCTKDGAPVYHFTSNSGGTWNVDWNLGSSNGSNKSYTYCSSTPNGPNAFSACWVSNDGDSITVRRGVLGNMGNLIYKVNSENANPNIGVACATFQRGSSVNSAVIYAGTSSNAYSTQEAMKTLKLKIIPQGFYNAATERLNMKDTVMAIVRNSISPYAIVDWGKARIDSLTYTATIELFNVNDGNYYISTYHRNTIETWTGSPINFGVGGPVMCDMTSAQNSAYGSNLIQVDATPLRFAIYSGDPNHDGTVDLSDLTMIYNDANNFVTGYVNSDITGDRFVDLTDLVIAFNNSQNFVSEIVP